MKLIQIALVLVFAISVSVSARAQESQDVEGLKKQIAALQAELEAALDEIKSLKGEIVELTESQDGKKTKKVSLSDRLPVGTVLEGDYRSDFVAGIGKITVTIDERNEDKLKGSCVIKLEGKDPIESNVEGKIRLNKMELSTTGSGNPATLVVTLKGADLVGRFKDSQRNQGAVGLRLPKQK